MKERLICAWWRLRYLFAKRGVIVCDVISSPTGHPGTERVVIREFRNMRSVKVILRRPGGPDSKHPVIWLCPNQVPWY